MISLLPKEWLAEIGAKGGKTTGESKRRPPEHYVKMVAARNAQRAVMASLDEEKPVTPPA